MTSYLRHAAVMLALLGGISTAAAQMTTTTPAPAKTTSVDLTPEQRTTIYSTVTKEKRKPLTANSVSVGTELPGSIELYSFPDTVMSTIPVAKDLKYIVWNDQVVVVDPTSMKVVELIRQ